MTVLINSTLGESRGKPRVWFEGYHVAQGGVQCGAVYYAKIDVAKRKIMASTKRIAGSVFSFRVSKRSGKDGDKPLVEIKKMDLLSVFSVGDDLRIIIRKGRVMIKALSVNVEQSERYRKAKELVSAGKTRSIVDLFTSIPKRDVNAAIEERLARGVRKLEDGEAYTHGSMFHGGGVLDSAVHEGFSDSGLESYCSMAMDKERKYLSASFASNSHLFREDSMIIESDAKKLFFVRGGGTVDNLSAGLPCEGASLSGRASNGNAKAEDHETAGLAFVSLLEGVVALNPITIILENVVAYEKSDGFFVLQEVLEHLGYSITTSRLNGADFGALEGRVRLCLVGSTRGMPCLDMESLAEFYECTELSVGDCLDSSDAHEQDWSEMTYLVEKEKRDAAKGNGFKRTLLAEDAVTVPAIKRLNHKRQSDGVFIAHPTNSKLSRLPSKWEHARFKTVPLRIVEGLSETLACVVLGQGVIYKAFVALGVLLGRLFKDSFARC